MQKLEKEQPFQILKPKTWPFWAGALAGLALVCAGAVGLVYLWLVIFRLQGMPKLGFALGVSAVFALVYALLLFVWRATKDKLCFKAALMVFAIGLIYVFASAPLQSPDESSHYLRAYSISQGNFVSDAEGTYPNDVGLLFEAIGAGGSLEMGHRIKYSLGELAPARIAEYRESLAAGAAAQNAVTQPLVVMKLPYLHQGLFMAIARLLGFGALGLLYAGRLANLALYAALCYRVFKNCHRYRGLFLALALLPQSLALAASCSLDGLMLPLCYLVVSYFCKKEIYTRDIVVVLAATMAATYIKPHNFVLVIILLLVPKARWKSRLNPWLVVGGTIAVALAFYWLMGIVDGTLTSVNYAPAGELARGRDGEEILPSDQLGFILQNPLAALANIFGTFFIKDDAYLFSLGTFGWGDLVIPLVSGVSLLGLCAAAALGIQQKEDTKATAALALFLAAAGYAFACVAGMYITNTTTGNPFAEGVQPRYMLPAILMLFMLFSILLGKAVRPRLSAGTTARTESITLLICMAVALFGAVMLVQYYYVGQWVPKVPDGGWKLVNMFGWVQT